MLPRYWILRVAFCVCIHVYNYMHILVYALKYCGYPNYAFLINLESQTLNVSSIILFS